MPNHEDYLKAIHSYHKQFKQTYKEVQTVDLSVETEISDVVIAGMGGSIFGAKAIEAVFTDDKLLVPVKSVSDYTIPSYADEQTLVILSSYSGNTEEVLSTYREAKERGCSLFAITSGGTLAKLIKNEEVPGYIFDTKESSSEVPRTGIGYNVGAAIGLLSKLNLLMFDEKEAEELVEYIKDFTDTISSQNRMPMPKQLSQKLIGKIPVFVSANHITTSALIWRNFMNETAKQTGFLMEIPNMNHHFLDGLAYPKELKNHFVFVYILSSLYHERNSKRIAITREITDKQGFVNITLTLGGGDKFKEFWETVIIGSLVSYNLADTYGENPSTNVMVDLLKQKLAE